MKETVISLISVTVGISLISMTAVGEKFKGSIRALSSLIVIVSAIGSFSFTGLDTRFSFTIPEVCDGDVYSSVSDSAEKVFNDIVETLVASEFDLSSVKVESSISLSENQVELESVNIYVYEDISLAEVMIFAEKEFNVQGMVTVTRRYYPEE